MTTKTEYLSTAKWDELHQALARALTPAAIAEWPGAHENALDQAAGILAELGVMPEEQGAVMEILKDFAHELESFSDGVGSADRLVKHARQVIEHGDRATKAGDDVELWVSKVTGLPRRGLTTYEAAEAVMSRLQAA